MAEIRPNNPEQEEPGGKGAGKPRKRAKRTTAETRPSREAGDVATGALAMAIAMSHPLRIKILYAMHSPERRCSASDLAEEEGVDVRRLSYHFRTLAALGFIEQVEQRPVRGSLERIYAPVKELVAWSQEYSGMPAPVRETLTASILGTGVLSLGAAIDDGTFDAREDSVIGQHSFRCDERGAEEALKILDDAVKELTAIRESAQARLRESREEGILISYLLAGYEGSLRPT